ncbi:MAG: hypothetical protein VW891_17250 [Novosphingobium sp.]|jgi:hypothetical protein
MGGNVAFTSIFIDPVNLPFERLFLIDEKAIQSPEKLPPFKAVLTCGGFNNLVHITHNEIFARAENARNGAVLGTAAFMTKLQKSRRDPHKFALNSANIRPHAFSACARS